MKPLILITLFPLILAADLITLDISSFEKERKKGTAVIDIRTPSEWRETGLIAKSVPLTFFRPDGSYDLAAFLAALKARHIGKETPFILVCRSASRTKLLGDFLSKRLGYKKVYQLRGGILNWKAHHKPLKRDR